MLVEDNDFLLNLLNQTFHQDYQLSLYKNGLEAIRGLEKNSYPDLIISDLSMPFCDGLGLLKHVRTSTSGKYIPFFILSGNEESSVRIDCLEHGADDFITKPFNLRELQARVKAQLNTGVMPQTTGFS
ncbi:response regulator [Spirosoma migulaei]